MEYSLNLSQEPTGPWFMGWWLASPSIPAFWQRIKNQTDPMNGESKYQLCLLVSLPWAMWFFLTSFILLSRKLMIVERQRCGKCYCHAIPPKWVEFKFPYVQSMCFDRWLERPWHWVLKYHLYILLYLSLFHNIHLKTSQITLILHFVIDSLCSFTSSRYWEA